MTAYLLIFTLLFSTLAFGQAQSTAERARITPMAPENPRFASYLTEVSPDGEEGRQFEKEAQAIAKILSAKNAKSAVLIDKLGYARELVLQSVVARLAAGNGKKILRINWNALYADAKDQESFDRVLKGVLDYVETRKTDTAIYLDDISNFSSETPVLGAKVATDLYRALSLGKMQILSAADSETFDRQIAADSKLQPRFEKIEVSEKNDDDTFVGDKLSPDLRELVAGADQNRTVKVILQSDDIDNPQLLKVLRANNVTIESRATAMDMLFVEMPVRAAEEIASLRNAKHLSLDREVKLLGHIETTTGTSLGTNDNKRKRFFHNIQPIGRHGNRDRGRRFGHL